MSSTMRKTLQRCSTAREAAAEFVALALGVAFAFVEASPRRARVVFGNWGSAVCIGREACDVARRILGPYLRCCDDRCYYYAVEEGEGYDDDGYLAQGIRLTVLVRNVVRVRSTTSS